MAQPAFRCQGGLAAAACGCDALPPFGIGNVSSGEDPIQRSFRTSWSSDEVTLGIQFDLATEQICVGSVTDGIKQSSGLKGSGFAAGPISQGEVFHPVVAGHVFHRTVPVHGDRRVCQHPISHGSTGTQLIRAHDQMHMTAVFGEINSLFACGITSTHDGQLSVTELRRGTVADCAGADAAAPVLLFGRQAQTVGAGSCGNHNRMAEDGLTVSFDSKGALAEIDGIGIGFEKVRPPSHSLRLHQVHQVRAQDSIRKPREVFNVGGGHQLATRDATSLKSSDQERLEIRPCGVNGCGVSGWS